MQLKTLTISLAMATLATADITASNYYNSLTSQIDPKNISIPSITQTSSLDVTTECTYYSPESTLVNISTSDFPTIWETATTNGMNTSAEFTALYQSIDWTKAPNISVRTFTSSGGLDTSSYQASTDPDCWWSASTCTVPKHEGINADIYKCDEPETWGLTYDDGPNCSHNAFYDYLQQQKLKASMFYIGSNVLDWPYGAMRGVVDGHHIASHTWSHPYMTTLTNQEVLAELYYTQKAIKLVTGLTPRYWRPPYGDVDDRVRWIASQLGLTAVIWNLDTDDWEGVNSQSAYQAVEQNYQNFVEMGSNGTFANSGNIVLTHEINNLTMSLALDYLPKITSAYKQVLDVATCQNISYPYFENYEWTHTLNSTNSSTVASGSLTDKVVSSANNLVPGLSVIAGFMMAMLF
ncbi:Chitin deacetylase [Choanephora cucurbitarum]|uniref:chitin deacetylase n=1 Tax=Choanephora cucurbitarum TaxID=101091 RepID=A0A1C7NAG8_9FUNG|nr:Chitin deacetylase [Choanephora cucurbitarum]